jgi:IS5 family transposase
MVIKASFLELTAEVLVGKDNPLLQLNDLIKWERFRKYLKGLHRNELHGEGGQPYDVIQMFKALLLQQWHSLSDTDLEKSLRTRLDFMLFTRFGLEGIVPDATTFCRFRNKLMSDGRFKKLLNEVNQQLGKQGLAILKANAAIVDATIIESAARPDRVIDLAHDREEPDLEEESVQISESADPDARWLKKGKRCYFGYKAFVSTESEHGFIQQLEVTPANQYEGHLLEKVVKGLEVQAVLADKGYATESNRTWLMEQGYLDGVMRKGTRGHPLSEAEKAVNRLISKVRFKVEQCFGTLKRKFQFQRARYFGLQKVEGQMCLKAICFNLLKASRLKEALG